MAPQSDRKCLADLASGERRERFGAGSIYIPYSIKSQLELQSEFPNHMIAIDSHCASVKKKTVAIQVTMELFFLLTETLLALWYLCPQEVHLPILGPRCKCGFRQQHETKAQMPVALYRKHSLNVLSNGWGMPSNLLGRNTAVKTSKWLVVLDVHSAYTYEQIIL
jgi:hypothetical protein